MKNYFSAFCIGFSSLSAMAQDGTLDAEFGDAGAYVFFPGVEFHAYLNDMIVDSQGRIVVCGYHWTDPAESGSFVGRLTQSGTLDASFANGGILSIPVDATLGSGIHGIAERSNGNYILGAGTTVNGDVAIELMEITPSGAINTSFGTNGTTLVMTDSDYMILPRM